MKICYTFQGPFELNKSKVEEGKETLLIHKYRNFNYFFLDSQILEKTHM